MKHSESRELVRNEYASWLLEIGSLHPGNTELWKYLQSRVNEMPLASMEVIAGELGLDVDSLCRWMLAYTGPKRKPYMRKTDPALIGHSVSQDSNARRFAAYRKSQASAKARLAIAACVPLQSE